MEDYIWNIRKKWEEGKNYTVIHQALILYLFKYKNTIHSQPLRNFPFPFKITDHFSTPPSTLLEDPIIVA